MAVLTEHMQRVREQRLGFCATVNADGTPSVSPKGTTDVWDERRLFFADICSPGTSVNIRRGSRVEVNVVDPFVRKGYRFAGAAVVHDPGTDDYASGVARLRATGSALGDRVEAIVVIEVDRASELVSPAYDDGAATEGEIVRMHQARFARIHERFEERPERDPSGTARSIVLESGEGHNVGLRGNFASFKALAATTSGRFSLMERLIPPSGRTPPAHIHRACVEAFYIVSGELDFLLDGQPVHGSAGTFVLVPGGVAHTYTNAGATDTRVLILHSPAMDPYFDELAALWSDGEPPSPGAERRVMRAHSMEPV